MIFKQSLYAISLVLFRLTLQLWLLRPTAAGLSGIKRSARLAEFYHMDWQVDWSKETITFELRVQTAGFVGFGLNHHGGMIGADMVIGGVDSNCSSYFTDRHGTGALEPLVDTSHDWRPSCITETWEDGTPLTTLIFNRKLDTCDPHDIAITNDTIYVIFSVGQTDKIGYHGEYRGSKAFNLLDPSNPSVDISRFEKWDINVKTRLSDTKDTVYWCTVHKPPVFRQKAHIVGFEALNTSAPASRHTHHIILHRCIQPHGENLRSIMEPYLYPGHAGNSCYTDPEIRRVYSYCGVYLVGWAVGGEPFFIPEHVGMPIGIEPNEYYFLEVHYDMHMQTPIPDMEVQAGIRIHYTYKLRENDAGVLILGSESDPQVVIPPNQKEYVHAAHCSSDCTRQTFPESGINVVSVLLHSHLAGRKLKVRHFRESQELPWIAYDNFYDFNFQANRALTQQVNVAKGDHLTVECTYNTVWRGDGSVTVGGYSTTEEMCVVFLMYYPLIKNIDDCRSAPGPPEEIFNFFGMKVARPGFIVEKPDNLKGMRYEDVLNKHVNWTEELVENYRQRARFGHHSHKCHSFSLSPADQIILPPTVTYPQGLLEYAPSNQCQNSDRDAAPSLPNLTCPECKHMTSNFSITF